jgi:hypothetical protein
MHMHQAARQCGISRTWGLDRRVSTGVFRLGCGISRTDTQVCSDLEVLPKMNKLLAEFADTVGMSRDRSRTFSAPSRCVGVRCILHPFAMGECVVVVRCPCAALFF